MRRVALLAQYVPIRVRLQDHVDDAGEPIQLGVQATQTQERKLTLELVISTGEVHRLTRDDDGEVHQLTRDDVMTAAVTV